MNMPVPPKMLDAPSLNMGLLLYWKAFQDLSSDRDVGMGIGPLPWSAMHSWATRNRISGDDFDRFVTVLRGMDTVFVDHMGKKSKKKMSKGKGSFNKAKAMRSK